MGAFVVLAARYAPVAVLVTILHDHAKAANAPYNYPREIEFLADLPKTPSGKVQRFILRAREKAG